MVGDEKKEFVYDVIFPAKTGTDKAFVEDLWARRKVGYLLDQIRVNGESKEVKDEVISLAKKYGITTPYTSYLVVPDASPAATADSPHPQRPRHGTPHLGWGMSQPPAPPILSTVPGLVPAPSPVVPRVDPSKAYEYLNELARPVTQFDGTFSAPTSGTTPPGSSASGSAAGISNGDLGIAAGAYGSAPGLASRTYNLAPALPTAQSGKEGVDLAEQLSAMRNQERVDGATNRQAGGRSCLNVNGVWIDEGANDKLPVVKIKAQSEAYFRMLQRHPEMKEVFQLGNRVVWVTPSQTVLVIDATAGEERLSDADIDRLFVKK